jgi:hypothetical protein
MVRWPLNEAGAGVFIRRRRVCLDKNKTEQNDVKRGASNKIKRSRGKLATCRAAVGMSVELK